MLWELLTRGANVVYQPAPFVHSKLFIVDRRYALIGSANWDARSLRLNFELMVEVYDQPLATTLGRHVDAAVSAGTPVSLAELDARSLPVRIRDSLCWLFTPYL
jgi:cardiolipin synthase A/B